MIAVLTNILFLFCAVCTLALGPAVTSGTHCSLFASPGGNDAGNGTEHEPFRTTQRLVDKLRSGQTGCLEAGTYTAYLRITHGGRAHALITIRSIPGAVVTLRGRVWIRSGSNYVTLQGLHIVGAPCTDQGCSDLPTVAINARSATLVDDEITNHHASICVAVGSDRWGVARYTLITRDVIHGCGRLPATNLDHGIYVADAVRTVISSNFIYDNADRGVQLFPHAVSTLVKENVIDANGEGILIGGNTTQSTTGSLVEDNVITNSRRGPNVESFFPAGSPSALANRVWKNCLYGGEVSPALGGVVDSGVGFTASANAIADPRYRRVVKPDRNLAADPVGGVSLAPGTGLCNSLLTEQG